MKTLVIHNPSREDIKDYIISEAKLDPTTGDPYINTGTGQPESTGRALMWSIGPGETVEFPAYVAEYLMGVFGFLELVESVTATANDEDTGEEEKEEEKEEKKEVKKTSIPGKLICKYCGKSFDTKRKLGMHMGAAHADELASE